MEHSDPYDLLRRARDVMRHYDVEDADAWLEDYDKLPGAELSDLEVRVLRDPYRRLRNPKTLTNVIDQLREDGYLKEVHHVGGKTGTYNSIRRSALGREALRLRTDVEDE